MKRTYFSLASLAALMLMVAGCATEPPTDNGRQELGDSINTTLKRLYAEDTGLQSFLNNAYAYVVFPSVGKGALVAGGAYGRGEVFEQGKMIGYADISQATVGLQAGGQTFTEVIAFETQDALQQFKSGKLNFDANASAVALKTGAAASAKFEHGIVVFVEPVGGLMVEAAVGGQSFSFQPL